MRLGRAFKGIGAAAVIVGLGAGIAVSSTGCGGPESAGSGINPSEGAEMGSSQLLPALDEQAPVSFQTASFAYG